MDDRLSELPEHLLHRILSFVDSKTTVETNLLSRRWRSVWKGVPALNINRRSFHSFPTFTQFVSHVLSRRHDSAGIEEITFRLDTWPSPFTEAGLMYGRLFDYAASHGNLLRLRTVDCYPEHVWKRFVPKAYAFRTLVTLHLEGCDAYGGQMLTDRGSGRVDPFAGFPCLRDLTLVRWYWVVDDSGFKASVRISGIQLRNLTVEYVEPEVEIFAPNLESLCYKDVVWRSGFGDAHYMPSLDRACVRISGHRHLAIPENRDSAWLITPVAVREAAGSLMKLFQGLHSARKLELHLDTVKRYPIKWPPMVEEAKLEIMKKG
ncbi:unnamed protein product [Linum tenue]|uniref:F-box domain-containing protein n=1 Tax=Linum tenue TaxID=586396 RepID=A0AAV0JUE9_9ROSI|nr:unnamed protein product [Linum tenue]